MSNYAIKGNTYDFWQNRISLISKEDISVLTQISLIAYPDNAERFTERFCYQVLFFTERVYRTLTNNPYFTCYSKQVINTQNLQNEPEEFPYHLADYTDSAVLSMLKRICKELNLLV